MGSGTTLVEAIVHGKRAYGTDINPVAVLITKAKTTPIEPQRKKVEGKTIDCVVENNDARKMRIHSCQ
jgi:DNA modification methylase